MPRAAPGGSPGHLLWPHAFLLLWLLVLTVSWLRFMRVAPAAQGRYFFAALPLLGLFWALGWAGWGNLGRRIGRAATYALGLLTLVTPFALIGPAYRPSPMPEFIREDYYYLDYEPPLATFGTAPGQIALLGVRTSYSDIPWGESQPLPEVTKISPGDEMLVRLAFLAKEPLADDWSLFIHLVDWSGLTVAQLDTMPGGGLRPTSGWPRYGVLFEDYSLKVPRTAYTPNRAHLQVGFYNHRTGERLPLEEGSFSYSFGAVTIPSSEGDADLPIPIHAQFADNIVLAAYRFSSRQPIPGEEMTVTLYWTASGPVAESYTVFAHLLTDGFEDARWGRSGSKAVDGGVDRGRDCRNRPQIYRPSADAPYRPLPDRDWTVHAARPAAPARARQDQPGRRGPDSDRASENRVGAALIHGPFSTMIV